MKAEVEGTLVAGPSCADILRILGCLGAVSWSPPRTLRLKLVSAGQACRLVPQNVPSTNFGVRLRMIGQLEFSPSEENCSWTSCYYPAIAATKYVM
jgi:hypothetical protein